MWFSHSMETTAPPGRVWEVWTDVAGWPTWETQWRDASLDDDEFAVDATGELQPHVGPSVSFVVTEVDPVRCYTYVVDLPLARLVVRRSLHGHDGGTTFSHEVWFEGLLGGAFSRTVGRRYRRAVPETMAAVADRAEELRATGSSTDNAYR